MLFRKLRSILRTAIQSPSAPGALLLVAAALAVLCENSPLQPLYRNATELEIGGSFGHFELPHTLGSWISDGLMVIFFLGVGLEIKRELIKGRLNSPSKAALPAISALCGMFVPAAIYFMFTAGTTATRGWAIPSATDIAFSLAILRVAGRGLPDSLRIFLTALAVLDDFGAIVIIALFYGGELALAPLGMAAAILIGLRLYGRCSRVGVWPYVLGGIALWLAIMSSGIHPTVAGVLLAFTIPLDRPSRDGTPVYDRIASAIEPWTIYLILPLFAFANAGVSIIDLSLAQLGHPVVIGIALGLFLGKQLGVFGAAWTTIKLGLCSKPEGASWTDLYGVAILTGIGFTMSLFTASLAFPDSEWAPLYRLGVLAGSLLSTILGFVVLTIKSRLAPAKKQP